MDLNNMLGPYTIDTIDTVDTITIDSATIASNTLSNARISPGFGAIPLTGGIYTTNSTVGLGTTPVTIRPSGTIDLQGENADIKVNGESMMETLRGIQDRLNMLRPNPELEEEWDQLRELGDQYRKLEAEFKEKSKMWNTLKK